MIRDGSISQLKMSDLEACLALAEAAGSTLAGRLKQEIAYKRGLEVTGADDDEGPNPDLASPYPNGFEPSPGLVNHVAELCHQVVMDDPTFNEEIGPWADTLWDAAGVRENWANRLILMGVAQMI